MTNERAETHACDCISRKAAIEEFRCTDPGGTFCLCSSVIQILEELPTIEPERKTGKWLPDTRAFEMMFVCSECKASLHVDTINLKPSWKYCPNCGAYMGGKQDGSD